jgi:hypothetical protein
MPSAVNYTEHDLVEALVSDLAVPPELRYADGWVGLSNRRGYVRLYRDLALNEFWDVPETRVRYIHELPPSEALPFGLNVVWVDVSSADAEEPAVYWRHGAEAEQLPLAELEQSWYGADDEGDDGAGRRPVSTTDDGSGPRPDVPQPVGRPRPRRTGHRARRHRRTRLPH